MQTKSNDISDHSNKQTISKFVDRDVPELGKG
jgi:hypothetical protein